jgi:hypothetical protein
VTQQRLKGQEVSIRVLLQGVVQSSIDSVGSFNDTMDLELKQDGFLGEPVNRFDEILNGYGGDFEIQVTTSSWVTLQQKIRDRATRVAPGLVFNIVRTDLFPSGDSLVITYVDVHWGQQPTSIGSRGDYVKIKASFGCSERDEQVNQL